MTMPTHRLDGVTVAVGDRLAWRGEIWTVIGFTANPIRRYVRHYPDYVAVRNARGVRDEMPQDTILHGGAKLVVTT